MSKENLFTKFYLLWGLVFFSFLLRFISVFFFRDVYIDNEWQVLLYNLINNQSYSFYTFGELLIPSAYMPPMYPFFLYFVKMITSFNEVNFLHAIIFIQVILSTYSVYIFYQINKNFFSDNFSLINSFIFSIIPLNIYYCGQFSSINLQIIFSLLFIKFLIQLINEDKLSNIVIFSIVSSLLILTRGEFLLIFILFLFFIIFYKRLKLVNSIKIIMIVIFLISPYVVRNYIHFNQVFIVKSLGYNLWKGNNQLSLVEGYENLNAIEFSKLNKKLENIEQNKVYEINRDQIFFNEAINNLNENSFKYIKLFFKKVFSYYFIDLNSNYPNYYNLIHIVPILIISILSLGGFFVFFKENNLGRKSIGLYILSNLLIFSVFFILPRYKLIILPVQIILAADFIIYIMRKYGIK